MSLTRVVDRATVGIALTTQATVPSSTSTTAATADLAEPLGRPLPLHHPRLAGGRVDQAVLGLAVLALLPQWFLFLQQNGFVWTSGHLDIWTVN